MSYIFTKKTKAAWQTHFSLKNPEKKLRQCRFSEVEIFFRSLEKSTLPETNNSPLKMDGWKTFSFPFGFRPHARSGCKSKKFAKKYYPKWWWFDSKVVSTHLWNTPLNFYQQAISRDSFHNWRCRGIAEGVRYRGVLQFSWIDGGESQFTKWCKKTWPNKNNSQPGSSQWPFWGL